jgi:hypothetical protein
MCLGCCCIQILLEEVGNGAQELYILNRYQWVGHQWQLEWLLAS